MAMDKEDSLWMGGVIGMVVVLLVVIAVMAPQNARQHVEGVSNPQTDTKQRAAKRQTNASEVPVNKMPELYLVAAKNRIPSGAKISEDDVTSTQMPLRLTMEQMLTEPDQAVGQIARRDIEPGQPISKLDLELSNTTSGRAR